MGILADVDMTVGTGSQTSGMEEEEEEEEDGEAPSNLCDSCSLEEAQNGLVGFPRWVTALVRYETVWYLTVRVIYG